MHQDKILLSCKGGHLVLPAKPMLDRSDGGQLLVLPPRVVWDRTALNAQELGYFSALVAAGAAAMLAVLPQLQGGCINYWDAGNWALNDAAPPEGVKNGVEHRKLHLHLLGRSPQAQHPDWRWGESPKFPDYVNRSSWMKGLNSLNLAETGAIMAKAQLILVGKYGFSVAEIEVF
jgi:hypothetical protein